MHNKCFYLNCGTIRDMDSTHKTDTGYDFSASENQQMVGQMAKDFAEKHIRPHVMEWDEAQHFPVELFKKLGELGMMGVVVPEQYGGSGFGYFEYVTVIQEIAKVCGSIGLSVAAHNSLCTGHILAFGNEEQKHEMAAQTGYRRMAWCLGTNRSQYRIGCHADGYYSRIGWRPLCCKRLKKLDHTR